MHQAFAKNAKKKVVGYVSENARRAILEQDLFAYRTVLLVSMILEIFARNQLLMEEVQVILFLKKDYAKRNHLQENVNFSDNYTILLASQASIQSDVVYALQTALQT